MYNNLFFLIYLIILNINSNENYCIQGIYNLLDKKKMEFGKTKIFNLNFKTHDNYFYKGTLFFWLKQTYWENINNTFDLLSILDKNNKKFTISFNWITDKSTMIINKNPININQKYDIWAYYAIDFENYLNDNLYNTKIKISSIYEFSSYQFSSYISLDYLFLLDELKILIGNKIDKIFDSFNGDIYDLKWYNGWVKNILSKYNTSFKEPKLIYFIDFLKHPSYSQIFINTSGSSFSHSINGINIDSTDIHDLNNISNSDYEGTFSNDFIINQPYQFIKLPKEWIKVKSNLFYQKSLYLNLKVKSNNQFREPIGSSPLELYFYKRINKAKENIISLSLEINSFTVNTDSYKNEISSKILLKDSIIKCYINLNITDKNLSWNELNIRYLVWVMINNPFKKNYTFVKLFVQNYSSCVSNLIRKFSDTDDHYLGDPTFDINTLTTPTIYSIRFLELGFFNGGDFLDNNSCYYNNKLSGKLLTSFSVHCSSINYLNRQNNFYNCENKPSNCIATIRNCEICLNNMCIYCREGYRLVLNECEEIKVYEIQDNLTKKIIIGEQYKLTKINEINLESLELFQYNKNKIKIFKLVMPSTINMVNWKQKNFKINNELSYFSENTNFDIYYSLWVKNDKSEKFEIKSLYNNAIKPNSTFIFNFSTEVKNKLYVGEIKIDCNETNKSLSFPCKLCSYNPYKIIINNIYSNCISKCPPGHFNKDFICYPCPKECKSCTGPEIDNSCICIEGFKLINNKCVKCDLNCNDCNFEYNYCTKCNKGLYLKKHLNLFGICNKCDDNCEICYNKNNNECLKCNRNYFIHNNLCVKNCPNRYYINKNNRCLKCSNNCFNCLDEDNCIKCINSNFYLVNIKNKYLCKPCSSNCKHCINRPDKCIKCNKGYKLIKNKCEIICQKNFFKNLRNNIECVNCNKCNKCFSNNKIHCLNCDICKKNCILDKNKINDKTFLFKSLDFKFNKLLIKENVKIYNITDVNKIELVDYYLFFHFKDDEFTIKMKTVDYTKINITISKDISVYSESCYYSNDYIINEIDKKNNNFFIFLAEIFKIINIIVYFTAIVTSIFFESLAAKLVDIFKLSQFFKYILLVNLNLGESIQEFLINSNPNSIIDFNFFDEKTLNQISIFLIDFIDYKPLKVININTIIVKSYIILFFLIMERIFQIIIIYKIRKNLNKIRGWISNLKFLKKKKVKDNNKQPDNEDEYVYHNKLKLLILICKKVSFTMLRLDSVNIFFVSIAFFKIYFNLKIGSNLYLFINSIVFLFINTFGYIHLYNTVEWIKLKLEGKYIDQIKQKLTNLTIMMNKKKNGTHLYLTIIEEIKYNYLILILFLFKKFVLTQLILIISFFLMFFIITSFSLIKDSKKYLLYFLSETSFLLMLFPIMFSVFFKIDEFFSFIIILFIFIIYLFRFSIFVYYSVVKIRKKIIILKLNKVNVVKSFKNHEGKSIKSGISEKKGLLTNRKVKKLIKK